MPRFLDTSIESVHLLNTFHSTVQFIEFYLRIKYQCRPIYIELRFVTSQRVSRWYNQNNVLYIWYRHLAHKGGLPLVPEPFFGSQCPWQRSVRRQQHVSVLREMIFELAKSPVKILLAVANGHIPGWPHPSNCLETCRQISIVLTNVHRGQRQPGQQLRRPMRRVHKHNYVDRDHDAQYATQDR